jgi:hypothetical protein
MKHAGIAVLIGLLAGAGHSAVSAAETRASVLSQTDLDHAIATRLGDEAEARDRIKALLQRNDVRELAKGYGLDLRRAEGAVDTLRGEELQRLAAQVARVDAQLAGGDVVISMSLVAILLIVIIVILLTQN